MSIRPSGRIVVQTIPLAVCIERVRENATQTIGVNVASCCAKDIDLCLVQGAAKTFQFRDAETVDYSGASEITFDIWQRTIGGPLLLSKSKTGGDILTPDGHIFQFTLGNSESAGLPKGRHHCEAWVTLATGQRRCVGIGRFEVQDSRKHD
jgi:hypothetical protein